MQDHNQFGNPVSIEILSIQTEHLSGFVRYVINFI
ncbi:hypothetical protein Gotri_016689 [Gossypium trilobum]|uniref:Uncharacterized protein n=1 Tax=Gossypium trilobum TaxID=34281 RepID=A0A7J9E5K9_9ROSI|nr:hypothetical protein [Gossypium trilobum]